MCRISSRSSSRSALLFLRRLKNSSRTLTTIALTLTPSLLPLFEGKPRLCADMEELRVGKLHAGLAGLHDFYFFALNMAQRKKDDPGQIALYARLLCDCFAQSMGGAASFPDGRPSPLPLAIHFPPAFFAASSMPLDALPKLFPSLC